jgi:hypothetical protein
MVSPTKARIQENALADAFKTQKNVVEFFFDRSDFVARDLKPVLVRSDDPWMKSKLTGSETQIDVLAVFEVISTGYRVALLIENKAVGDKKFQPRQPERYKECAIEWAGIEQWGMFSEARTVLVAYQKFLTLNPLDVAKFDLVISHEALSTLIPEFSN